MFCAVINSFAKANNDSLSSLRHDFPIPSVNSLKFGLNNDTFLKLLKFRFFGSTKTGMLCFFASATTKSINSLENTPLS